MHRPILKTIHLAIGILALIAFLLTGLYMDRQLAHLVGMPDAPRALYRSGHIYILFGALMNMVLGVYLALKTDRISRALQYIGSALLLGTPFLFLYGFIVETPLAIVERPMVREGIVWSLGGVLFHGLAASLEKVTARRKAQTR